MLNRKVVGWRKISDILISNKSTFVRHWKRSKFLVINVCPILCIFGTISRNCLISCFIDEVNLPHMHPSMGRFGLDFTIGEERYEFTLLKWLEMLWLISRYLKFWSQNMNFISLVFKLYPLCHSCVLRLW